MNNITSDGTVTPSRPALGRHTRKSGRARKSGRPFPHRVERAAHERLRRVAARLLGEVPTLHKTAVRVARCGEHPIPTRATVAIAIRRIDRTLRAHFQGLLRCGTRFCAECELSRLADVRTQVTSMAMNAIDRGLTLVHLTVTMAHRPDAPSVGSRRRLDRAWSLFTDGRRWRRIATSAGVWGVAVVPDYTWSAVSGHHHHLHVIAVAEQGQELVGAADELAAAWCVAAKSAGGWATTKRGLRLAGVARLSSEARRIALHAPHGLEHVPAGGHYSSWNLLKAAAEGDEQAARAWIEYAASVHGTRHVRVTPGLPARLGVAETDKEPCRAIVAEIPATLIGQVCPNCDWICVETLAAATIRAAGGPAALLNRVEEIIGQGGGILDVQPFIDTLVASVHRELVAWAAEVGGCA